MTKRQEFENNYKIDPIKLVEDVNLSYINIVKKIGLQSLIATYVEDNFSFKPTKEFYILLVECFLESKERFPQGEKLILDEPYTIANIPLNPSIPTDKGELESFKNIVSQDTLRPAMTGVFVDEEGYLIGTDAYKIVKYRSTKYNQYQNKIINLTTYLKSKGKLIEFIDAKYPNYNDIFPQQNNYYLENQNLYAWYNYAKSVSAIRKYISNSVVNCNIELPTNEIYSLNPIILSEVLEFFISKGYEKCTIGYENKRRGILFVFDGSLALIMPMVSDELNGTSSISVEEINNLFSDRGSKISGKKVTPKKTQTEEEEPNIAYKKFEGKITDTTYIPRRDISYVKLKNGDKLYSSDIIDGVYKLNSKMADGGMMADGGKTNDDDEDVDLFENYDNIPPKVQRVLTKHSEAFEEEDYDKLSKALSDMEKIGYTFEYGLDGVAYNLRKKKR
jgi:hypothetical protein